MATALVYTTLAACDIGALYAEVPGAWVPVQMGLPADILPLPLCPSRLGAQSMWCV